MHKQLNTVAYHEHFSQIPQFSTQREWEREKCVMEVEGNPNSNLISLLFKKKTFHVTVSCHSSITSQHCRVTIQLTASSPT